MSAVPPPPPPGITGSTAPPGVVPPPYRPATPGPVEVRGGLRPDEIRPKQRWIWISVAVVVVGVVAAVVVGILGFVGISDQIDDFERVQRGVGTIEIDERRELVIYNEAGSGLAEVTIVDPDGQVVRTRPSLTSLTYSFGGRSGVAIGTFEARQTGTYSVATDRDIAVGPSIGGPILRAIAVPFVVGAVGFLAGAVMLVIVLVRRSRSKTRLMTG